MAKEGKRGTRPPSAQAQKLRKTLKRNIELLMDRDYPAARYTTKSARQIEVAKDIGISWSSIQRALDPDKGVTLDIVADIAAGFAVKPHEILDPDLVSSRHLPQETAPMPGTLTTRA